jgi:hypothetical protein
MVKGKKIRIKFKDLPADKKISKDELKRIRGGLLFTSSYSFTHKNTSDSGIRFGRIGSVFGPRG